MSTWRSYGFWHGVQTLFLVFLVVLCWHNASQAQSRITIAEGVGAILGEDLARARDEALRDARRRAVEQAVGTFIQAQTMVENFEIIEDSILSQADGYVTSEQILSERRDGNLYRVRIQAEVDHLRIEGDLSLLIHKAHNPQIMIVISETNLGDPVPFSTVEAQMRQIFVEKGFHVIDPTQFEKNRLRELTNSSLGAWSYQEAATIAQRHESDVLILGTAYTEIKARDYLSGGLSAITAEAYLDVRAVNAQTAQVVVSATQVDQAYASSGKTAGTRALEKTVRPAVDVLIAGILTAEPAVHTIQIIVSGVHSFSLEQRIQRELGTLRGTEGVYRRFWENGVAQYDVKTTATVDDISIRLESLPSVSIRITGINLNEIRAVVAD